MSDRVDGKKFILYSYWRSSCSWRVRLALELKGIPYEYRPINLLNNEQISAEYLAINPAGLLPSLLILNDDSSMQLLLNQSSSIIEYLEETFNGPAQQSLLPKDPILRARTRALAQTIASEVQPLQNLRLLQELFGDDMDARKRWASKVIRKGFAVYERMIVGLAGMYSVGDQITLADLHLVPQVYNAQRFSIDIAAEFPTINGICKRLESIEAFCRAHPDAQPDRMQQSL